NLGAWTAPWACAAAVRWSSRSAAPSATRIARNVAPTNAFRVRFISVLPLARRIDGFDIGGRSVQGRLERGPERPAPHVCLPARGRHPLLNALAVMLLAGVDVASRIGSDAAHAQEPAGLTAAVADGPDFGERVALDDQHLLVMSVGDKDVLLTGVVREGDIPHRPVRRHDAELPGDGRAARVLRDDPFLDELSIFLKDLNPVARPVADIDHPVLGDVDAGDVAELPRRRCAW